MFMVIIKTGYYRCSCKFKAGAGVVIGILLLGQPWISKTLCITLYIEKGPLRGLEIHQYYGEDCAVWKVAEWN